MIAISNTSPLIILAKSSYLKNLQRIFKHIIIPEAVFDEIFRKEDITSTMIRELIDSGFIKTKGVKNKELVSFINADVGLGEAEAIVLSLELNPDYLLMDDYKARIYAEEKGINVIGTLGLVKIFHDCNFVDEDAGMIYERLTSANFWIEKDLFFKVMRR